MVWGRDLYIFQFDNILLKCFLKWDISPKSKLLKYTVIKITLSTYFTNLYFFLRCSWFPSPELNEMFSFPELFWICFCFKLEKLPRCSYGSMFPAALLPAVSLTLSAKVRWHAKAVLFSSLNRHCWREEEKNQQQLLTVLLSRCLF